MDKTHGTLVIQVKPGQSVYVGDDIVIEIAEIQGTARLDGSRKKGKPTRLRIRAPLNMKINRTEESMLEDGK